MSNQPRPETKPRPEAKPPTEANTAADAAEDAPSALQAVQAAMDRRDNGGAASRPAPAAKTPATHKADSAE